MMIISSGLNVVVESCDVGGRLFPEAPLGAGGAEIGVVMDGGAVFLLAGQLDSEVHIVHDVLLDQDSGAPVHVNAIGILLVAVGRITARGNVVNQIAAYNSVAS